MNRPEAHASGRFRRLAIQRALLGRGESPRRMFQALAARVGASLGSLELCLRPEQCPDDDPQCEDNPHADSTHEQENVTHGSG